MIQVISDTQIQELTPAMMLPMFLISILPSFIFAAPTPDTGIAPITLRGALVTDSVGLYSSESCTDRVEQLNIGNLNECHTAISVFHSFEILSNGLGAATGILAYTTSDCSGVGEGTGDIGCLGSSTDFLSFQLADS